MSPMSPSLAGRFFISEPPGKPQVVLVVKPSPANAEDGGDAGFDPWVGKIPWRRTWQPTPAFLPGESHGQRRRAGHRPEGCKESVTTEVT